MAEEKSKSSANIKPRHILLVFAAISILAIFMGYGYSATTITANVIKVPYDVQVPYDAKENYDVQEPYTEKVCNDVQVPYSDKECTTRDYSYALENRNYHYWSLGDPTCWVKVDIVNHEGESGVFRAYTTFDLVGNDYVYDLNHIVYAHSKKTVTARYDCSMSEDIQLYPLKVDPPKKTDCKDVIKYRTEMECKDVTKYQTVTKERTVTKHRREVKQREETKMETVKKYPQIAAFIDNILH